MGLSPGRVRFIGSRCHSLPSLPFRLSLSLSPFPLSSLPSPPPARHRLRHRRASSGPPPPPQIRPRPHARLPARGTPGAGPPLRFASPPAACAPAGGPRRTAFSPSPPRSWSLRVALLLRGPTPCDSRDPLTASSAGDCSCSWIGGRRRCALGTAARM